jgi:hypothetical protein
MEEGGFGFGLLKRTIDSYRAMPAAAAPLVRLDTDAGKLNSWVVLQSHTAGFNMGPYYKGWGWPVSDAVMASLASLPAFVLGTSKANSSWVAWANADASISSGGSGSNGNKGGDIWTVPGAGVDGGVEEDDSGANSGAGSITVVVNDAGSVSPASRGNGTAAGVANASSQRLASVVAWMLAVAGQMLVQLW